ncbi:MAG: hypothetical protein JNL95_04835 [Chitinophagales bacterium]|nr:hypothetical protein [Chitinophagales bacterium]
MTNNETLQNQESNNSKITYEQFGRESAQSANGNSDQLKSALSIIFNEIVRKSTLDENQKKVKVQSLNNEKVKLDTEIIGVATLIKTKDVELQNKQKELDEIEQGKGHVDLIPLVISSLITILLTFFLWIFYSGSSYGALNEKIFRKQTNGLSAIFEALGHLISYGSGIEKSFYTLFPILFIGLGFLIHDGLVKKNYLKTVFILTFTFLIDIILGYLISRNLYNSSPGIRFTNPWQMNFILLDPNFYLILFCGFAGYIIWGFLLNSSLQKFNDMQPTVRQKQVLRDKGEIEIEITKLNGQKVALENSRKEVQQEIEDLGKGVVFIDVSNLRALVGYFMQGWGAWLQLMKQSQATELISECNKIADDWLAQIIISKTNSVIFKQ